jgi:hypothetical protein
VTIDVQPTLPDGWQEGLGPLTVEVQPSLVDDWREGLGEPVTIEVQPTLPDGWQEGLGPLTVDVEPRLPENWRKGLGDPVTIDVQPRLPENWQQELGPLMIGVEAKVGAGIPPFCGKLASFYFRHGGDAADDMLCTDVGGASACRAEMLQPSPTVAPTGSSAAAALGKEIARRYPHLVNGVDNENRQLLLVGYTDSTGNAAVNLGLSRRRANAVRDALDLPRLRAAAIGRGEEVDAVERGSGILLENPLSRRVDVYYCDPSAGVRASR